MYLQNNLNEFAHSLDSTCYLYNSRSREWPLLKPMILSTCAAIGIFLDCRSRLPLPGFYLAIRRSIIAHWRWVIIGVETRKLSTVNKLHIGAAYGFAPSLVLIVQIRNVDGVTVVLDEAVQMDDPHFRLRPSSNGPFQFGDNFGKRPFFLRGL